MVPSHMPAAPASPDRKRLSQVTPSGVVSQSVLARLNTVEKAFPVSWVPSTPGISPASRISPHSASSSAKFWGTCQPCSSISVWL